MDRWKQYPHELGYSVPGPCEVHLRLGACRRSKWPPPLHVFHWRHEPEDGRRDLNPVGLWERARTAGQI